MTAVNQEKKCKRLVKDFLRSFNNEMTTLTNDMSPVKIILNVKN